MDRCNLEVYPVRINIRSRLSGPFTFTRKSICLYGGGDSCMKARVKRVKMERPNEGFCSVKSVCLHTRHYNSTAYCEWGL